MNIRVFDKLLKKFVGYHGYLFYPESEYVIQRGTGKLDRNNVEMFEGDYIFMRGRDATNYVYEVKWDERRLGFVFWHEKSSFTNDNNYYCSYEIIGNNTLTHYEKRLD